MCLISQSLYVLNYNMLIHELFMLDFFTKGDFRGVELNKTNKNHHQQQQKKRNKIPSQTKKMHVYFLCSVFKDTSSSKSIRLLPLSAQTVVLFAGGNVAWRQCSGVSDWRAEFCLLFCHWFPLVWGFVSLLDSFICNKVIFQSFIYTILTTL